MPGRFKFNKRAELFVGVHNEPFSVTAMCIGIPDRSPVGIKCSDAAPTPPGFLKIVRHYLEWFIRSEEILVVIYRSTSVLPGRCAGNSLLPFPYNESDR